MKTYELYLILNPILGNEAFKTESKKIQELLETKLGAQNIEVEIEGLKKLAYPINKQWTGCYLLVNFELEEGKQQNFAVLEKALNINTSVIRYMFTNMDEYTHQKSKEKLNETDITTHNELNKTLNQKKKCIVKHVGFRVIDYKDTKFLSQFMSPYAKIFTRERTGVSAKYQRKLTKAIKKARHMALLPFTSKHMI
ncbi:MAG: 30S ribosomal protein S18 [Patescibacteria group bacterium]